jgi:hypothetical protein
MLLSSSISEIKAVNIGHTDLQLICYIDINLLIIMYKFPPGDFV